MANWTRFAWFFLAAAALSPSLIAEAHCPGNVASVPYHRANRSQMIVAVSINHRGPYDFLLDTGTQMTMVDQSLVQELGLETHGVVNVASVGATASAAYAQVASIGTGERYVANQTVLAYDLRHLQAEWLAVRGVLGEDFLEHFDLLIDNDHSFICLDEPGALHGTVKGASIPLVEPADNSASNGMAQSLIVAVRLTDGLRPVRLKLDSGANMPFLYNASTYMALGLVQNAAFHGGGNGARFTALPQQKMKIGSLQIPHVTFATLSGAQKDTRTSSFDGLLPLSVFRRVLIEPGDRAVVLEAW